ncbi:tRNA 2-thiouridine(34) synthase MnmA [Peptococcaceae bacterium]|nr:tRNA 2-thiouridine(34) synthase MnmA [Peptococcaceae bacterium]
MLNKKKVCVALSGGVDSSVAAMILQDEGFDCIGITMDIGDCENLQKGISTIEGAKRIADKLGIPHYVVDVRKYFEDKVIKYFANEYLRGYTPNPCVVCNYYLKFGVLLDKAIELGADYIATGHYVKLYYSDEYKRFIIKKAVDKAKDQTYFLYKMSQYQIAHTLMPLGGYTKKEVQRIAIEKGLFEKPKAESQEICFIPDGDYRKFLKHYLRDMPDSGGDFVDLNGKVIGKHLGIQYYTIGQRRGLGVALGKRVYVVDIVPESNTVVLGPKEALLKRELISIKNNFILFEKLKESIRVEAKIRYNAKLAKATIKPKSDDEVHVIFDEPQNAITPGQSVVFYKDDMLLGGGVILRAV